MTEGEGGDWPEWDDLEWWCRNKKCPRGITEYEDGTWTGGHEYFDDFPDGNEKGTIADFTWKTFRPGRPTVDCTNYAQMVDLIMMDDEYFDNVTPNKKHLS